MNVMLFAVLCGPLLLTVILHKRHHVRPLGDYRYWWAHYCEYKDRMFRMLLVNGVGLTVCLLTPIFTNKGLYVLHMVLIVIYFFIIALCFSKWYVVHEWKRYKEHNR